jgi:hypothetical protein
VAANVVQLTPRDIRGVQVHAEIQNLRYLATIVSIPFYCCSLCRKLNHPNLSSCLGVKEDTFSIMIISPLVHGCNLQDVIFDDEKVCTTPIRKLCYLIVT